MKCMIKNNSSLDLGSIMPLLKSFLPFAKERMGFNRPPSLEFLSDSENAELPLGKTAHYSPEDSKIVIFVDKRHPKDIMRSLSHELVHHNQNCNGKFSSDMEMGEGYAQKDGHLREMEKEAYLEGNLLLRDWEDFNKKDLQETIYYETFKGDTKMSINDIRNARINNLLMEKFGYNKKEALEEEESEGALTAPEVVKEVEEVDMVPDMGADAVAMDANTDAAVGAVEAEVDQGIAKADAKALADSKEAVAKGAAMEESKERALRKKIREVLRNSFNVKP